MGAECWMYMTRWEPDVGLALHRLRQHVFLETHEPQRKVKPKVVDVEKISPGVGASLIKALRRLEPSSTDEEHLEEIGERAFDGF